MSDLSSDPAAGFLPAEPPRAAPESVVVRVVATAGVVGIGTAIGAILTAADVAGWIAALIVSLVSVVLAGVLWRSRRL
jgi:protein-S-isoprenylcysteine O-methyltransferase Ste14